MCAGNVLYGDLPVEAACIVAGLLHKQVYKKGEVLFREGDPCSHLFALSSGQVKLSYYMPDGREQIIGLGVPGYLLGFDTLSDETYTYTASALSKAHVCKIQHKDLMTELKTHQDVAICVLEALNNELKQTRELLRVMGGRTATEKTASFILSVVPHSETRGCKFDMPFSRHEIADLLGLTAETVSRVMAELKRAGIIHAPRGSMEIRDASRLRDVAAGSCSRISIDD
jgi:CRP/FNR family transcriptional regulator